VDWSGVAASYLPPNNPGCCCDQFFTELDLTLTALNGTVTTVSTKWCDEAIMLKMVPKPLQEFEEAFDKVCSAAALQCTSQPQPL
jgi:hypothetical protein